jgi:hypothetical protein
VPPWFRRQPVEVDAGRQIAETAVAVSVPGSIMGIASINRNSMAAAIAAALLFGLIFALAHCLTYSSFPDAGLICTCFSVVVSVSPTSR